MDDTFRKKAKDTLHNEDKLKYFAELNRLSIDAARALLERLLREPDISEQAKEYIFSKERSDDFKGYQAGEEIGYKKGHEAGFAKGAALGALSVIGTLTVAGLAFLLNKD
ncbi:hypothetical protein [Desulfoplanes formicivorans]|uniref:Uncharacterized protein n=1 Tax=Desulfoplanes formicivorans TaxID=1592317 RepID=A0A194AI40_9BACT|nr:hypothetical protein [Desulfoplanes formicivorans]GAU08429.1 hypothetical protein DPF_1138 [Desulfoplanes formicivorans]